MLTFSFCGFYRNFIVQFVIDLRHAIVNKCICVCVAEQLEHISTNKNGSYVVEKCLKSEGGELLLEAFVRLSIDKLEGLAMHPQGNYVLQCAIRLDKVLARLYVSLYCDVDCKFRCFLMNFNFSENRSLSSMMN